MGSERRLDRRLVALGLAPSRARAQAAIAAGAVTVDGRVETRASAEPPEHAVLTVAPTNPWVSRGGLKLEAALDALALSPDGARALDLGASTGGFTQVLRARGAARVYAVDVGRGQLAPEVAADPGVIDLSPRDARTLTRADVEGAPVDWITADLAFIGLAKALGPASALARPGATLLALVKPQFEVGPARVGKGGVVRDAAARAEAVAGVRAFLEADGWAVQAEIESAVPGADGNRETFLAARRR